MYSTVNNPVNNRTLFNKKKETKVVLYTNMNIQKFSHRQC